MKKLSYTILIMLLVILSVARIDLPTNIGFYGLSHNDLINDDLGMTIQLLPFGGLQGYSGSMYILLLLTVILAILLIINHKFDNNKKFNQLLFFALYSISLLIFEETHIRILGIVALSIILNNFLKTRSTKSPDFEEK